MTACFHYLQMLLLMEMKGQRFVHLKREFMCFLHAILVIKLKFANLQSIEEKAQKALECPCIAGLRNGPCGNQFSKAFLCFLKSTADEKVTGNGLLAAWDLSQYFYLVNGFNQRNSYSNVVREMRGSGHCSDLMLFQCCS